MTLAAQLKQSIAIEDLRSAITKAEETHIAAGLVVEVRRDDLTLALAAQIESRRALASLRMQLIEAEKMAVTQ